jgi:hypothetical protein
MTSHHQMQDNVCRFAIDALTRWDVLYERNTNNPPTLSSILECLLTGGYILRTFLVDLDMCVCNDKNEFYDDLDTLRTPQQRGHYTFFYRDEDGPRFAFNVEHAIIYFHVSETRQAVFVSAFSALLMQADYVAGGAYRDLFNTIPFTKNDDMKTISWWRGWSVYQPRCNRPLTKCAAVFAPQR